MANKVKENKATIKRILALLIVLFALTIIVYIIKSPELINQEKLVVRVIDGDTIELESRERVRLICVNAPEEGAPGFLESKEYLEDLILNKYVILEKDTSNKDKYGRLLRYVYIEVSDKKIFVNKEVVEQGFAEVYRVKPDTSLCDEISSDLPPIPPSPI